MKKIGLAFVLCLAMALVLTGCGDKTVLTVEDFTGIAQSNGCTVSDATEQFAAEEVVESVTIAVNDAGWQVEFYVLTDKEAAVNMFNYNQSQFISSKGNASTEASSAIGNYASYALTSDGQYMYICRVENTVLYVKEDSADKDAVKELVEKLGY